MKKILSLLVLTFCLMIGNAAAVLANEAEIEMSNTDKVVKFLQDSKVFYIATIDGKQPRVRPFGAALNIDGKVSICTGSFKNVYKQIKKNSNVEICAMTPDGKWIRVSGSLADVTNEENKNKFFEAYPDVSDIYAEDKRNDFAVLSFKSGVATIEDFSGNKEVLEFK